VQIPRGFHPRIPLELKGEQAAMSFGQPAQAGGYVNPNNDYTIGEAINDGIQDLAWSPTGNVLVSGSWDNYVRCWEVQQQGNQFNAVAKAQISHEGPVLCTAFSGVRQALNYCDYCYCGDLLPRFLTRFRCLL